MLQEAIRNYTQCYSVIAAVQGEVLARWPIWNSPLDFCLEQQHQLIRQKVPGTKTVSAFVFTLTVVLQLTAVVFTVGGWTSLHILFICVGAAVHA